MSGQGPKDLSSTAPNLAGVPKAPEEPVEVAKLPEVRVQAPHTQAPILHTHAQEVIEPLAAMQQAQQAGPTGIEEAQQPCINAEMIEAPAAPEQAAVNISPESVLGDGQKQAESNNDALAGCAPARMETGASHTNQQLSVSSNRDALPGPTTLTNVDLGLTGAWLRSLQKEKVAVTAPCPETGDEPDRVPSPTPLPCPDHERSSAGEASKHATNPEDHERAAEEQEGMKGLKKLLAESASRMREEGLLKQKPMGQEPQSKDSEEQTLPLPTELGRDVKEKMPEEFVEVERPEIWNETPSNLDPATQRFTGEAPAQKKKKRKSKAKKGPAKKPKQTKQAKKANNKDDEKKKTSKKQTSNDHEHAEHAPAAMSKRKSKRLRKRGILRMHEHKKHSHSLDHAEAAPLPEDARQAKARCSKKRKQQQPAASQASKPKQARTIRKAAAATKPKSKATKNKRNATKAMKVEAPKKRQRGQPCKDPQQEEMRLRNLRKSKAYHAALAAGRREGLDVEEARSNARDVPLLHIFFGLAVCLYTACMLNVT